MEQKMFTSFAKIPFQREVCIPDAVLKHLEANPGDKLLFTELLDGSLVIRAKNKEIEMLEGVLHVEGMAPISYESFHN